MEETHRNENFIRLRDVPDTYDEYYVYGIGMIESEFYQLSKYEYSAHRGDGKLVLCRAQKSFSRKNREQYHVDIK